MKSFPLHSTSRRRGFTLVEVLVVILIIITLAAIVVPVVRSIRKSAGSAITVANLRQIQAANALHASDNGGFFLGNAPFGEGTDKWGANTWFSYMPFATMVGVDAPGRGEDGNSIDQAWHENFPRGLKCGIDVPSPNGNQNFTIAMNWSSWSHTQDGTPFGSSGGGFWVDGKILQSRIKHPDKLIMFFESADLWGTYDTRLDWESDDGSWQKGLAFRNKAGACNVVFADGHVGSLTRKDIERGDAKTKRYFQWNAD